MGSPDHVHLLQREAAGGPHIELRGLKRALPEGERVTVTLRLDRGGEVSAAVPRRIDGDNDDTRSP